MGSSSFGFKIFSLGCKQPWVSPSKILKPMKHQQTMKTMKKKTPAGAKGKSTKWKKAKDDVSILDPIGEDGDIGMPGTPRKMETTTRNAHKGKGRSVPNTPTPAEVEEICRKNTVMKKRPSTG